jgi:hypothetical protein
MAAALVIDSGHGLSGVCGYLKKKNGYLSTVNFTNAQGMQLCHVSAQQLNPPPRSSTITLKTLLMKKTVFLSIALSLYGTTFSQTFFLRAGGGYALPVAHDGGYSYESGPTSETVSYIRWSLGEGSSAFLSAGFFSGKNFGAELHSRYFYGKEKSYRRS